MQWDKESTGTCPADQIRLFKIWGGKETGSLPPLWPPSSAEFRGSAYPNYKLDLFSHYLLQWWWMHCVWYLACFICAEYNCGRDVNVGEGYFMTLTADVWLVLWTNLQEKESLMRRFDVSFQSVSWHKLQEHISLEQFTRLTRREERKTKHNFAPYTYNAFYAFFVVNYQILFWPLKTIQMKQSEKYKLLTDRLTDMCNLWQVDATSL